ncbi:MAG: T9SS type A sorting domain-containing protein [Bacteroidales bacterium]|jgi:hypothetical protein|nr:T9SS type A sorting domain-containing protein [Bacteroidales bacterium]
MKKNIVIFFALCFAWQVQAQGYDPEEYYAPDVEVINNLIRNNGLLANIDDPTEWSFITWSGIIPKRVVTLDISNRNLSGIASFFGLFNMISDDFPDYYTSLNCANNHLLELNLVDCIALRELRCSGNNLTELNVADIELRYLSCSYNNLTELVTLAGHGATVYCDHNRLTKIILGGTWVYALYCWYNQLTSIEGYSDELFADNQQVSLTLHKNWDGIFSCSIPLKNPIFDNSAISYENGILKSTSSTIASTKFTTSEGSPVPISGTMYFTYSEEVGMDIQDVKLLQTYIYSDKLYVKYEENLPITIILYDIFEKKILTHTSQGSTEIDVNHLQKGVYIVSVLSESRIIGNTKIVK